MKLPELNLHPFDGNYINWLTFSDTFKESIHDSTELSDVVKFTYLVSLLQGSAKEAIAGLSLTSANYKDAVNILNKRFGDHTNQGKAYGCIDELRTGDESSEPYCIEMPTGHG